MSLTDEHGRYTCSSCGAREQWGEKWRWKIASTYTNSVRRLLMFCSDACGESTEGRAHDGSWRYAVERLAR